MAKEIADDVFETIDKRFSVLEKTCNELLRRNKMYRRVMAIFLLVLCPTLLLGARASRVSFDEILTKKIIVTNDSGDERIIIKSNDDGDGVIKVGGSRYHTFVFQSGVYSYADSLAASFGVYTEDGHGGGYVNLYDFTGSQTLAIGAARDNTGGYLGLYSGEDGRILMQFDDDDEGMSRPFIGLITPENYTWVNSDHMSFYRDGVTAPLASLGQFSGQGGWLGIGNMYGEKVGEVVGYSNGGMLRMFNHSGKEMLTFEAKSDRGVISLLRKNGRTKTFE
jgi:hypothetical protein